MRVIKTIKWFLILAGIVLTIFAGAILLGKKPVAVPEKLVGASIQTSAMERCQSTSCLDLDSQGIDFNQWQVILAVVQEAESQGYLKQFENVQTGEVLKEKIVALDDIVSDEAKALPVDQTSPDASMLGGTGLTLGQLLDKAKLAKVIY